MESREEFRKYYKEHGGLLYGKGRTITDVTAREILEVIESELSEDELATVKEAMLSVSRNGINWRSRGEFVGDIKWRLTQMKDKHEFAKEVVELSIRHIQMSDDLNEQGKKVYHDQSLDYSKYLMDGTIRFRERKWQNKIPVLANGTPLEEFFLKDMDAYPEISQNRVNYYDYDEDVMAQVVREIPILPIFLMYIRPMTLQLEEKNGVICYDGYFNEQATTTRVFVSPFQRLNAEKENYTIGNVNVLLFLMAQENKNLFEVVDNLIQAFDLDISLRTNHVEEDKFVARLRKAQGKLPPREECKPYVKQYKL